MLSSKMHTFKIHLVHACEVHAWKIWNVINVISVNLKGIFSWETFLFNVNSKIMLLEFYLKRMKHSFFRPILRKTIYNQKKTNLQLRSKLVLFADDMTVYFSADSNTSVSSLLSDDLNKICSWFDHNRLVVNWI